MEKFNLRKLIATERAKIASKRKEKSDERANIIERLSTEDDPSLIIDNSTLQIYISMHGLTKKLQNRIGKPLADIFNLSLVAPLATPITTIITHFNEVMEQSVKLKELTVEKYEKYASFLKTYAEESETYCNGLGMKRTKFFLSVKARNGCKLASAIRSLLEIELAKNMGERSVYSRWDAFWKTDKLITDLIALFLSKGWKVSYKDIDDDIYRHLVVFEIPSKLQVSFKLNLKSTVGMEEFDGEIEEGDTNKKLESLILTLWDEEIEKKIADYAKRDTKKAENQQYESEQEDDTDALLEKI